jgi:hypothetical protein
VIGTDARNSESYQVLTEKVEKAWKRGGGGMREGVGEKEGVGEGGSNEPVIVCTYE